MPNRNNQEVAILLRHDSKKTIEYPVDHKPGMRVPKGGSSCKSCEYLKDAEKGLCRNIYFIKWNGSEIIPGKIDEYCSDWYAPQEK
jgi:hypothetical protein